MGLEKPATRRHFTDAARVAAAEVRRRKRELGIPKDIPEVFVVRRLAASLIFGWEIRRFGAVVIEKSLDVYATTQEARVAGESALSSVRVGA